MFIINNPLRPLRRRQYHTSAYSVIKGGPSPSHRSLVSRGRRERAGKVGKKKEREGAVRLLSSVPHEASGFLFLKSSARFTCLIILFHFWNTMGSLCGREKVRPGRFFPRSKKNKQTNKCSKAGRDITRR